MIVKIDAEGGAHIDYEPVSLATLRERVAALIQQGGHVTYYRESPETDGTDAAAETFRALLELKPRIQLGMQAPSEWGRLEWVELEESPHVARFFLARGQRFLVSRPPSAAEPRPPVLLGGPLPPEDEDEWFTQIDLLVRSDRVVETPGSSPEMAMSEAGQAQPALHVRIAYDRVRWASWYPSIEVPSHIESFRDDLWLFATRFAPPSGEGRRLTNEEASRFFEQPR